MKLSNPAGFGLMLGLAVTFANVISSHPSRWPLLLVVGVVVALVFALVVEAVVRLRVRHRSKSN
jgi:membrane protein implicated in regulation of membrane protease activity